MLSTKWCSLQQKGVAFGGKLKIVKKQKATKLPKALMLIRCSVSSWEFVSRVSGRVREEAEVKQTTEDKERGTASSRCLERQWGGIERASGMAEEEEGTVFPEVTGRKRSSLRRQQE